MKHFKILFEKKISLSEDPFIDKYKNTTCPMGCGEIVGKDDGPTHLEHYQKCSHVMVECAICEDLF